MGCILGCYSEDPKVKTKQMKPIKNTHIPSRVSRNSVEALVSDRKELMESTYANTPRFSFNGKTCKAKCVKVYDGDTITVVFSVYGTFYKFNVRMNGYDSPELKSKDPIEKKWAIRSRDLLASLILERVVTLECLGNDKYGRLLANIKYDGILINNYMVTNGFCRKYEGGTKHKWDFSKFEKKYKEEKDNKE